MVFSRFSRWISLQVRDLLRLRPVRPLRDQRPPPRPQHDQDLVASGRLASSLLSPIAPHAWQGRSRESIRIAMLAFNCS